MLTLYRRLLALRRAEPALAVGDIALVDAPAGVLAYDRIAEGRRLSVLLNLTDRAVTIDWRGTPLLSTLEGEPEPGMLAANEGLILT
jgi:oligo-1,6-glucosidase/alpha-glucosidase